MNTTARGIMAAMRNCLRVLLPDPNKENAEQSKDNASTLAAAKAGSPLVTGRRTPDRLSRAAKLIEHRLLARTADGGGRHENRH